MQFCFPYIESVSFEKLSGQNSLICIPQEESMNSPCLITGHDFWSVTAQILGQAGQREMEVMRQGEGTAACSSASIFHV